MAGFEDVTLSWAGQEYVIPVNRVMRLLYKVEAALIDGGDQDALTVLLDRRRRVPVAAAYEVALDYAGAGLPPGEVYLSVMDDLAEHRADHIERMLEKTMDLMAILAPPIHSKIAGARSSASGAGEKK